MSDASSPPPAPRGERLPADRLHPVWEAARARRPAPEATDKPRYERISLSALETAQYCDADGAESRVDSERAERAERAEDERAERAEAERAEDDELFSESEDEPCARRQRLEGLMGAAAFGGAAPPKREASRDAFPVRGVSCVGCALPNRIGPVNRFIQANISNMSDDALWKMAAFTYDKEVCQPAVAEGASVPSWPWKGVRAHYELHVTSNFIARHKMVRQLQCMRAQLETRLVRVDGEDREVDRQTAELMLKTLAAESKERQLLDQAKQGRGKGDARGDR